MKCIVPIAIALPLAVFPLGSQVRAADAGSDVPKGPYSATLVSASILSTATFPGSSNPVADVTTAVLSNGTIRAYVIATNLGIVMAESTNGTTFTYRGLPFGGTGFHGQPRVIKLVNGTWVMYNGRPDGFSCSTSADGLTFTVQTEVCLSKSQFAGVTGLTSPGVIRLANGTYRAYFSDLPRPGKGPLPFKVFSATSPDGLIWSAESGVRIGEGAQNITRSAEHPTIVRHSDGTFTMFYFDNGSKAVNSLPSPGVYYATSNDGLVFSNEFKLDLASLVNGFGNAAAGNDPEVFLDGNGRLLMYFGVGPTVVAPVEGIAAAEGIAAVQLNKLSVETTKSTTVKAKIGGACTRVGIKTTVGKTKLVCKKVKGRTVWVKG